jgi:hypothetical protein
MDIAAVRRQQGLVARRGVAADAAPARDLGGYTTDTR